MSGKRARFIKDLIDNGDPNLFFTLRKIYGKRTEDMSVVSVIKEAKKHWNIYGIKDRWGKPLREKEMR